MRALLVRGIMVMGLLVGVIGKVLLVRGYW
jgi:hypothetical protein